MSVDMNMLLRRSAELETELSQFFSLPLARLSPRVVSCRAMCGVSFEHAESLKVLVTLGNFTSVAGLLRLQYESLVRAFWLLYAASDEAAVLFQAELTPENVKKADKLPMLSEMLKQLEGKCPGSVESELLEFKEYSWKPLSSFVHGGLHAIHRHSQGYPVELLVSTVKHSNGLLTMASALLAVLSGNQSEMSKIPKLQRTFADCIPPVRQ